MSGLQDCSKYDIMLSARLDGALNRKDARELEKHLAECAECRQYLRLLETVKEGLREDLPDPPEALREGIMYKIGLEKQRKLHFGAFGRWTAIAAVLCVVIFGVVKLSGSGVMKAAAPEAAPAAYRNGADEAEARGAADAADEGNAGLLDSKLAAPAVETLFSALPAAASPDSADETAEAPAAAAPTAGSSLGGAAKAPAENSAAPEPGSDSVYRVGSLPGYDLARAALDSGNYWGVCLFYGSLPEDVSTRLWQTRIPEDGEKERWQLSAEELQVLEKSTEWNEFYYGDLNADQGLVLVIAGEEE